MTNLCIKFTLLSFLLVLIGWNNLEECCIRGQVIKDHPVVGLLVPRLLLVAR
jgi:hypothetical protein